MSQAVAVLMPAAVDYERTLVLAIEVSNKSWVLAAQVPGRPHTKAKRTIDPKAEALLAAIAGYRACAAAMGRSIERVIAVYESANGRSVLSKRRVQHGISNIRRCSHRGLGCRCALQGAADAPNPRGVGLPAETRVGIGISPVIRRVLGR
jgi:hypothetical protein